MGFGQWRWSCLVLAGVLGLALAGRARAQVSVAIDGDTANATISLPDGHGGTYDADVTIVFDSPENLTATSLNLTAEVIDPSDPVIADRLAPTCLTIVVLNYCPKVDPAFPVLVTVEPVDFPWLFTSGFEDAESGDGDLLFHNSYHFEVHTHDLAYTDGSPYRLFKAPVGGNFHDVTNDVLAGSVRVRGRGGDFSQFLVVSDPRNSVLLGAQLVAAGKIVDLNLRILAAALDEGLQLDLLGLLAQVDTLLLVDLVAAIDTLDQLIDLIDSNAGTNIANVWSAHHDVVNDAGELAELAYTLRFSMTRMLGGTANP